MTQSTFSLRSDITISRTYSRELDSGVFETWGDIVSRCIMHQNWLWARALNRPLNPDELAELEALRSLMTRREVCLAGRTLFLGGTRISQTREASQFNCSFAEIMTVRNIVSAYWLLLQGCGVGFEARAGCLWGFPHKLNVKIIRSTRKNKGIPKNTESVDGDTWTIIVGDSAEAWAKAIGKIVAGKHSKEIKNLIIDLQEIRPAGERLKGYGWICAGDSGLALAAAAICEIMNGRAGSLLRHMDIHDIMNWLGTTLSSRRSAQISLFPYGTQGWEEFANCKPAGFDSGPNWFRSQSNNSLTFDRKPTKAEFSEIFGILQASPNGAEPGIYNMASATNRAPYVAGTNPCGEILLPNCGFCNLVEIDVAKFRGDSSGLLNATNIVARANYRQTCVDLEDGILEDSWHQNNQNLRLCGVGLTGVVRRTDLTPYDLRLIRRAAWLGSCSMADELGTPRPANVTTIKPSGTMSKIMDTSEGLHKPLGRYIFNKIVFPHNHELIPRLLMSNYRVESHPKDSNAVLVTIPFEFSDIKFEGTNRMPINLEPAVAQLERYKLFQDHYTDQNSSITVSYSKEEVPEIIDWLSVKANWDSTVGLSFMYRTDPLLTEEEVRESKGFAYLPQQVVDKDTYHAYTKDLTRASLSGSGSDDSDKYLESCVGGACPVR